MSRLIFLSFFLLTCLLRTPAQVIQPSVESGVYKEAFTLFLETSDPSYELHYTLDGTSPSTADQRYDAQVGILIEDRSKEENNFSAIPTIKGQWIEPQQNVAKAAVVWAQHFDNGQAIGDPVIFSYFVGLQYSFPIFSIVGEKSELFGDSLGIMVPGENYDANDNIAGNAGLRGREWERPVQLEFFENNELILRQNIGLRIHGLSSRSLPQKSLRLYARNDYGKKYFSYPFFPDTEVEKFKRLILRSPASDWSDTFFKDEMIHQLSKEELEMDVQDHLPCILFINGEYWGIYNLRERIDEYHFSEKLDIDEDDINLLESDGNIIEGENQDYLDLFQFVKTKDLLKDENYEEVTKRIDIQNFIDYHITELFFANQDWPRNNYRFWQATQGDQRWRWVFFDCDFCMIFHHDDHLGIFLDNTTFSSFNRSGEDFPEWSVLLLRKLLKNEIFRNRFVAQFFNVLTSTFSTDQLISRINTFEKIYAPEVGEHIQRWNNPSNLKTWTSNVDDMRKFALQRPAYLLQKFQEYVGSPFNIFPNPSPGNFSITSALESTEIVTFTINSANGQILNRIENSSIEQLQNELSAFQLSPGVYLVEMVHNSIKHPHLLIVQ